MSAERIAQMNVHPPKSEQLGNLDFKKIFEKGKSFDVSRLSVRMKSFFLGHYLFLFLSSNHQIQPSKFGRWLSLSKQCSLW